MKIIAVDIDDTLNNYNETLQSAFFPYKPDEYSVDEYTFNQYIKAIREGKEVEELGFLLISGVVFHQIHTMAQAKPDAALFMQWLKNEGYTIVILTYRRLQTELDCTKEFLNDNNIPYDYLFSTDNKIKFCKTWGIPILIDDDPFNVMHGGQCGLQVYYPIMEKHNYLKQITAKGYHNFDEVKKWIS